MTMNERDTRNDETAFHIASDGNSVPLDESGLRTSRISDVDPVVRHGVDLVSIERIASLLAEFGESFRCRAFTASERAYCEKRGTPPQHYAARWAAKEAFCKTLDAESPAIPLDSIEVIRERTGPQLRLEPPAARALDKVLDRRNIPPETTDIAVSLSHDRSAEYAIGSVTVFGVETASTDQ
ncbi:holo-ACP synthase [Haloterrigena sp. SYSU A121-1]|uniref:Holo-ACP synthase n=1 Tax=Haloterrigena gelatinilytica TaxID=2741724 RepID=A0A8J8GRJ1_9EURY|nr:holo-ACP synthase [Haloterrigena gelatinilytica]NUB93840.1 holo-ACP synthase [Haloterrigena gelatinilytica]